MLMLIFLVAKYAKRNMMARRDCGFYGAEAEGLCKMAITKRARIER